MGGSRERRSEFTLQNGEWLDWGIYGRATHHPQLVAVVGPLDRLAVIVVGEPLVSASHLCALTLQTFWLARKTRGNKLIETVTEK